MSDNNDVSSVCTVPVTHAINLKMPNEMYRVVKAQSVEQLRSTAAQILHYVKRGIESDLD